MADRFSRTAPLTQAREQFRTEFDRAGELLGGLQPQTQAQPFGRFQQFEGENLVPREQTQPEPEPTGGVWDYAKLAAEGLTAGVASEVATTFIGAAQGRTGAATPDAFDTAVGFMNDRRNSYNRRAAEKFGVDTIKGRVLSALPSIGTSLATIPVAGLAMAAGTAAGSPVAGVAAGFAAPALLMARSTEYREAIDKLSMENENRKAAGKQEMTTDEAIQFVDQYEKQLREAGLWEAGPEGLSSLIQAMIISRIPGGSFLKGAGKIAAGSALAEVPSEALTEMGMSNVWEGTPYQTYEQPYDFKKPGDYVRAVNDVWVEAMTVSGGIGAGGAAYKAIQDKKKLAGLSKDYGVTPQQAEIRDEDGRLIVSGKQIIRDRYNQLLAEKMADPRTDLGGDESIKFMRTGSKTGGVAPAAPAPEAAAPTAKPKAPKKASLVEPNLSDNSLDSLARAPMQDFSKYELGALNDTVAQLQDQLDPDTAPTNHTTKELAAKDIRSKAKALAKRDAAAPAQTQDLTLESVQAQLADLRAQQGPGKPALTADQHALHTELMAKEQELLNPTQTQEATPTAPSEAVLKAREVMAQRGDRAVMDYAFTDMAEAIRSSMGEQAATEFLAEGQRIVDENVANRLAQPQTTPTPVTLATMPDQDIISATPEALESVAQASTMQQIRERIKAINPEATAPNNKKVAAQKLQQLLAEQTQTQTQDQTLTPETLTPETQTQPATQEALTPEVQEQIGELEESATVQPAPRITSEAMLKDFRQQFPKEQEAVVDWAVNTVLSANRRPTTRDTLAQDIDAAIAQLEAAEVDGFTPNERAAIKVLRQYKDGNAPARFRAQEATTPEATTTETQTQEAPALTPGAYDVTAPNVPSLEAHPLSAGANVRVATAPNAAMAAMANSITALTGTPVVFIAGSTPLRFGGAFVDGTIYINAEQGRAFRFMMGHETYHSIEKALETTEGGRKLLSVIDKQLFAMAPESRRELMRVSTGGRMMKKSEVMSEMRSDLFATFFDSPQFWNEVLAKSQPSKTTMRTLFDAVMRGFDRMILAGTSYAKYRDEINGTRKVIAEAFGNHLIALNKDVTGELQSEVTDREIKFAAAYHGSPHQFDAFSLQYIGTGEGNQAYGWGMYFSQARSIAEWYKDKLAGGGLETSVVIDGKKASESELIKGTFAENYLTIAGNVQGAIDLLNKETQNISAPNVLDMAAKTKDALDSLVRTGAVVEVRRTRPGALYQVELAPKETEYLLWDVPLSEQSRGVRDTLRGQRDLFANVQSDGSSRMTMRNISGRDLYEAADVEFGSAKAASEYLRSIGIRGIKFLDGSSRREGEGSYNYVIFDDADVEITARFRADTIKFAAAYHWSPTKGIQAFNLDRAGQVNGNAYGYGLYLSKDADDAAFWGRVSSEHGEGHLYTADIPSESTMLDWFRPLKWQSKEVREALQNTAEYGALTPESKGEAIYDAFVATHGSEKAASEYLNSLGILGTKVDFSHDPRKPAETSVEGHKAEYVVFSPDNAQIVQAAPEAQFRADDVSPLGYYSALARGARNIKTPRLPATSWVNALMKQPEVKAAEIEWTGLEDWLATRKGVVTKEEVVEFLNQGGVQVVEVVKGGPGFEGRSVRMQELVTRENDGTITQEEVAELDVLEQEVQRGEEGVDETKFTNYTLPGGTNQREIMLVLNSSTAPAPLDTTGWTARMKQFGWSVYDAEGTAIATELTASSAEAAIKSSAEALGQRIDDSGINKYHVPQAHQYGDSRTDINRLAHIRLNDRIVNGQRVLFIEEIQSDWNLAGRRDGFKTTTSEQIAALIRELTQEVDASLGITVSPHTGEMGANFKAVFPDGTTRYGRSEQAARRALVGDLIERHPRLIEAKKGAQGVPSAPFIQDTSWQNLALKRIMRMAAEEGYDRVAWVTGEQTAERYSLDKAVDSIDVLGLNQTSKLKVVIHTKESGNIRVLVAEDGIITGQSTDAYDGKKLDELIGKEVAEKVMNAVGEVTLTEKDLKIEAKWARALYDKAVPDWMGGKQMGKKFGVGVETIDITTQDSVEDRALQEKHGLKRKQRLQQSLAVTEEMRAEIMLGQPLFRADLLRFTPAPIAGAIEGAQRKAATALKDITRVANELKTKEGQRSWSAEAMGQVIRFLPVNNLNELYGRTSKFISDYTTEIGGWMRQSQAPLEQVSPYLQAMNSKYRHMQPQFNKAAIDNSLLQIAPWDPIHEQDWVPRDPDLKTIADKMAAAEEAWKFAGMHKKLGMTFREAYKAGKDAYDGIAGPGSGEVKAIYKTMSKQSTSLRRQEIALLEKTIQELAPGDKDTQDRIRREMLPQGNLVRGAYWPEKRFGRYSISIKRRGATATHQNSFRGYQSRSEQRAALEAAKRQYDATEYEIKVYEQSEQDFLRSPIPMEFANEMVANVEDRLKKLGVKASVIEDLAQQSLQLWFSMQPETSATKRSIKRKTIHGANYDYALNAMAQHIASSASNLARLKHGKNIERILSQAHKDIQDKANAAGTVVDPLESAILRDLNRRWDATQNATTNWFTRGATKMSSLWYMSSPSAYMVQASQPLATGLPKLMADFGPGAAKHLNSAFASALSDSDFTLSKLTAADLTGATEDIRIVRSIHDKMQSLNQAYDDQHLAELHRGGLNQETLDAKINKLSAKQQDMLALLVAIDKGALNATMINSVMDAAGLREGTGVTMAALYFMRKGEEHSRIAQTLAGMRSARAAGYGFHKAADYAAKTTNSTMFDYSQPAKPAWLQYGLARAATQFQYFTFSVMARSLVLTMKSLGHNTKGMPAAERRELMSAARKELTGMMGMSMLLGGMLGGVPTAGAIALIQFAFGFFEEDEPRERRGEWAAEIEKMPGGSILTRGIMGAFGMDVSRRIGMADSFGFGDPGMVATGGRQIDQVASQLAGPWYSAMRDFYRGYDMIEREGKVMDGLIAMSPKGVKDVLKAVKFGGHGIVMADGTTLKSVEELTDSPEKQALFVWSLLLQSAGVAPTQMNTAFGKERTVRILTQKVQIRRTELVRDMVRALDSDDSSKVNKVLQEVIKFNERMPAGALSNSDFRSAATALWKKKLGVRTPQVLRLMNHYGLDD